MKKLIHISLAIILAMSAAPAFAVDADGLALQPYVAARVGTTYMNLDYKYDDETKRVTDTVFQGRAALGMSFYRSGRTEIEGSIFTKANHNTDFTVGEMDVGLKMKTLMLNAYMDLGKYEIIQPFIGAGAGAAFTTITRNASFLGVGASLDDEKDTRLTAMGTVGLSFALAHFALDVSARYTYVDLVEGMHNFGGDVGIRISF